MAVTTQTSLPSVQTGVGRHTPKTKVGEYGLATVCHVKSTSPDTENHDKNGYAKLYDDKNLIMTNVDNDNSDKTYTNKHKDTEYNVRDMDE